MSTLNKKTRGSRPPPPLSDLYRTILLSFLSAGHVGSKSGDDLLNIEFKLAEKQLPTKMLQIGKLKPILDLVESPT